MSKCSHPGTAVSQERRTCAATTRQQADSSHWFELSLLLLSIVIRVVVVVPIWIVFVMCELQAGTTVVQLIPDAGCSVSSFRVGGFEIFRSASAAGLKDNDVLAMGCFPLVPYSNRVCGGTFSWNGATYSVPKNHPADSNDHPLHGHGWLRKWAIETQAADSATLRLDVASVADYPSSYIARQMFSVTPGTLTITMSIQNTGSCSMPVGLGPHPYFPVQGARLQANLTHVWLTDNEVPTELIPVPTHWSFSESTAVQRCYLNHCFTGWDGVFVVEWPEQRRKCVVRAVAEGEGAVPIRNLQVC
eukprot:TRINITY_DN4395_c0_g1_i1.p1 TRINITY_DN4395_c0_g1~~TRINITY_DN4395_c0_g1_i1.p1  ORF type:complete len:303 (-),score=31.35 TRINITY_DN4395_c0_g1_i1:385-1293(-)